MPYSAASRQLCLIMSSPRSYAASHSLCSLRKKPADFPQYLQSPIFSSPPDAVALPSARSASTTILIAVKDFACFRLRRLDALIEARLSPEYWAGRMINDFAAPFNIVRLGRLFPSSGGNCRTTGRVIVFQDRHLANAMTRIDGRSVYDLHTICLQYMRGTVAARTFTRRIACRMATVMRRFSGTLHWRPAVSRPTSAR